MVWNRFAENASSGLAAITPRTLGPNGYKKALVRVSWGWGGRRCMPHGPRGFAHQRPAGVPICPSQRRPARKLFRLWPPPGASHRHGGPHGAPSRAILQRQAFQHAGCPANGPQGSTARAMVGTLLKTANLLFFQRAGHHTPPCLTIFLLLVPSGLHTPHRTGWFMVQRSDFSSRSCNSVTPVEQQGGARFLSWPPPCGQ